MARSRLRTAFQKVCACLAAVSMTPSAVSAHTMPALQASVDCVPDPCVKNAAPDFSLRMPGIHAAIESIAALPRTGKATIEKLRDPANDFRTCANSLLGGPNSAAALYLHATRTLAVAHAPHATHVAHEAFHAMQRTLATEWQGYNSGFTDKETVFISFVLEANAVAYTYVVAKEADVTTSPGAYAEFTAHHGFGLAQHFDAAYAAAWDANAQKTDEQRLDAALSAGGQAITRMLVNGYSRFWADFYSSSFSEHYVSRQTPTTSTAPDATGIQPINVAIETGLSNTFTQFIEHMNQQDTLAAKRTDIMRQIGHVTDTVNMTPPEYLLRDITPYVEASLTHLSFPRHSVARPHMAPIEGRKCTA